VDYFALPMLAILGAAIGTSRVLEIKPGWIEGPRLYTAVVDPPGTKKSPALGKAAAPMTERQRELQAEYEEEKAQYARDLAQYEIELATWREAVKRKAQGKILGDPGEPPEKPEEPVMRQLFTTDSTMEALGDLLERNPRGLVFLRDELTAWARAMDQYRAGKGADRQHWLSFWSGATVIINRKSHKGPVVLHNPFVAVTGCLPPDVLGDLADERGREDGFIHRVLFGFPAPFEVYWTDDAVSEEAMEGYRQVYAALGALQPARDAEGRSFPDRVRFTPEGRRRFVEWATTHYEELADRLFPEHLRGPWAKMDGYCARLALILQECRFAAGEAGGEEVDAVSVLGAAALIDYFKSHARRVYACLRTTEEDKQVAQAVAWIRRQGGQVTARDLLRARVAGCRSRDDAQHLLRELENRGYGTREEGARRTVLFRLAPAEPREGEDEGDTEQPE
jgi:hypothetical protein